MRLVNINSEDRSIRCGSWKVIKRRGVQRVGNNRTIYGFSDIVFYRMRSIWEVMKRWSHKTLLMSISMGCSFSKPGEKVCCRWSSEPPAVAGGDKGRKSVWWIEILERNCWSWGIVENLFVEVICWHWCPTLGVIKNCERSADMEEFIWYEQSRGI